MTGSSRGWKALSHDLPHHPQVKLIINHLGESSTDREVVICREQLAARGLVGTERTRAAMISEGLHQLLLIGINGSHGY